jgi:peptidoglycan hydrolase CwlO-like protein
MTRRAVSFVLIFALATSYFSLIPASRVFADTTSDLQAQIDAHTSAIDKLNQQIAQYEAEIQQANAEESTLQSTIGTLNLQIKKVQTQVSATQSQIAATQLRIEQLGKGISATQDSIDADQAALAEDIRGIQQADTQPLLAQLLSSGTLADAWSDVDAATQIQGAIQSHADALSTQKTSLVNTQAATKEQKAALTAQKNTLAAQQLSLTQTKNQKSRLLAETNASEAGYQKLLSQAKAELASFSTFAANAGGSGLLPHNAPCDSWGCYYNQRDVAWGNDPLNGTQYRLKSDGCLVTSMAMVMTHYGYRDVTPITINSNPSNFAAYYPAYLLYTIYVDGMTVTRKSSYIDATLASGNPVVVGLNAYGGTHFVVLTSGSNGHYLMRDPYIPNADDVSFSEHYSLNQIFGVSRVLISS